MSEELKAAYNYTIRILSRKDYSKKRLLEKMLEKGHSEEVALEVIEITEEKGYLNEDNYIRAKIKSLIRRYYSKSYIFRKLAQESLQFDDDLIDKLYEDENTSESDQIEYLIDKKMRSVKVLPTTFEAKYKLKNKILSHVAGKGHSPSNIISKLSEKLS